MKRFNIAKPAWLALVALSRLPFLDLSAYGAQNVRQLLLGVP
jgi:hypothetical protein